jgi:pyruvate/2-oxoglutarate dehydrogenase complex dihydrolipoamide dehydrogenase (E3) component
MKLVVDGATDRVSAATSSAGAGEMIQVLGIAIRSGRDKADLRTPPMAVHSDRGGRVVTHARPCGARAMSAQPAE